MIISNIIPFDYRKLVTAKGEIDREYLVMHARIRGCRDYGAKNPPAVYVRPHILNLETQADFVRYEWRRDHGLVDDRTYHPAFTVQTARRYHDYS